ncbi:MAG: beta-ketoacyl-[acyl-carrier-protein] synthase family protein [Candidatus Omnitrophota bacterium]|jgi:3-oxoacyl-[acyl-carrier-protein] synthase II
MVNQEFVISAIGIVAPGAIGKEAFWNSLENGASAISKVESFSTDKFSVNLAGEIKNFDPKVYLGQKGLRNLDRSSLFLMTAAKFALDEAKLEITEENTDDIGVSTGTTFPHLSSMIQFDREVINDGLEFSNPALFPSTVLNAASSQVSIRFNIQGYNASVSTGFTSSLQALKYALESLNTSKAKIVLCGAVESLTLSLYFGFYKLGYIAGVKGEALSCPFDRRRNGPVLAEAAAMFCVEEEKSANARNAQIFAKIKSVSCYFDGFRIGKIHPEGEGLEKAIKKALDEAGVAPSEIDYISSCANSSQDLDSIEVKVLKNIFGDKLSKIPISSIKSMLGETLSASGALQIASCIGAMQRGVIPPTINYKEKDPECDIDCVPNHAQKKDVKIALVVSFGPGGYNSACILEKVESRG